MNRHVPYFLLVAVGAALDQVTKTLVAKTVALHESVAVIPGFFNITHIRNRGAIFGLGSQSASRLVSLLLGAASLIALGFVVYYFFKTPPSDKLMKVALTLIMTGALGNHIDRVMRGNVVDFLDFYVGRSHWPFFNVADTCISVGAALLILAFFRRKPACTPSS